MFSLEENLKLKEKQILNNPDRIEIVNITREDLGSKYEKMSKMVFFIILSFLLTILLFSLGFFDNESQAMKFGVFGLVLVVGLIVAIVYAYQYLEWATQVITFYTEKRSLIKETIFRNNIETYIWRIDDIDSIKFVQKTTGSSETRKIDYRLYVYK